MTVLTILRRRDPAPATAPAATLHPWHDAAISALLLAVTVFGLVADAAYRVSPGVRADFADVMRGQDVVTLLTVPALLWAGHRARRGSMAAHFVRLGLLLYYAYTYVIYAFAPYNDMYLAYVALIGLSVLGLLDGMFRIDRTSLESSVDPLHSRGTGMFLVAVGVLFVGLWMVLLLPAIPGDLPAGRVTYDIASAVHTLDLSMVLPLVVASGIMLVRRRAVGVMLGAVVLCKIVTLGLALLAMNLIFTDEPNAPELLLWGTITAVAAALLVRLLRHVSAPSGAWMRDSIWR